MIYKFKTGGRPLVFDTDKMFEELKSYLPAVKKGLKEWRDITSGFRNEEILGTSTRLPEWLEATYDTLAGLGDIDLNVARELRDYFKIIKRLSSTRFRTRQQALEPLISKAYVKDLESAGGSYKKLAEQIKKLNKKQRAEFFQSNKFQYASTFRNKRYKRIRDWAQADSGKELTYKQSYAYLLARRLEDGLSADFDISGVTVENAPVLPFGED